VGETWGLDFIDLLWEGLDDTLPASRQPTSVDNPEYLRSPPPPHTTFKAPPESLDRLLSQQTDKAETSRTAAYFTP
jgi:hypothetical protein